MQYYFEIYLLKDVILPSQWDLLYGTILQYGGRLERFELLFTCSDNVVRFFIASNHDLSGLSNSLDGLLLRVAEKNELPASQHKVRFIQFVSGGTILDLKEKTAVKKSIDLEFVRFSVRTLGQKRAIVKTSLLFKNKAGQWLEANKTTNFFPSNLLSIDFASNTHYLKKNVPRYLNIEKSLHMLVTNPPSPLVEVETFPYLPYNYFLNLNNYDFDKHSFIIGATGSGKSKFISLYVDRLYKTALKNNYRIVVIDPHASLADDFDYLLDKKIINFNTESTGLFPESATDVSAATELTTTLFKSLLNDQYTARLERLLRFSLFVLFTAQTMSLDNLKRYLSETEFRNQVLQHVADYVPKNVSRFFGADFNEIKTTYHNEAIMPIVALVDEMQLQPGLVNGNEASLAKTVQENFLTVFSLNKVRMGEKTVKTIAGLIIQQIFLLAQSRILQQKVILIIDEVSVVQNPAIASILAEARKFNLSVILTQQYFGQIEKDLQAAIFSNVYNYYVFRVSEEDARALEGNLNMELPTETQLVDTQKGLKEADIRVRMLTELHPRECMLRLSAGGKLNPCIKCRTVEAPTAQTEHGWSSPHLNSYAQSTVQLPAKFEEQSAVVLTSATAQQRPAYESPQPVTGFNLSQLLSEHSSSRLNVKERGRP